VPELTNTPLSDYTTLRLGGPAQRLVEVRSTADACALIAECDQQGEPLLVLGGGSNVVIGDAGFDGTVLVLRTRGIEVLHPAPNRPEATAVVVAGGHPWDEVVAYTVEHGLGGLEALSGVPGSTGATPIQNVGAYGQEVSQTIVEVQVWDRHTGTELLLDASECGFVYRSSIFKGNDRYVVLGVVFHLLPGGVSAPVRYPELARRLGVEVGEQAAVADVREAVLQLRRSKGMVLDADDPDTFSAGSFFTNPILDAAAAARLPEGAPRYPAVDAQGQPGAVKTSAAWLIEQAGFTKGYANPAWPHVSLSTKHTLALTNRGGASTAELVGLAQHIVEGVQQKFGITLRPEPVFVGADVPS
jgi:UDP-N-acetylmuramate dehydrogenase